MARVGVDIDGVLYPFDTEFKNEVVRRGIRPEEDCPPPTCWKFYEAWGMSTGEFNGYCNAFTNDGSLFQFGVPYAGSMEAMWRLREAGHTIVLITTRHYGDPGILEKSTRVWLEHWTIPFDELHFAQDKRTVPVDYHVDDHTDNHVAMRGHGVQSWLLNRPWNKDDIVAHRVNSLSEYVDRIQEREAEKQDHPAILMDVPDDAKPYSDAFPWEPVSPTIIQEPTLSTQKEASGECWACERNDVLNRFMEELEKVTGDGSKKRQKGDKPPWYVDQSHEGAIFSHLTKWKRGEQVDPDSGAHPLVHAAWRCLAIACSESGNHPDA